MKTLTSIHLLTASLLLALPAQAEKNKKNKKVDPPQSFLICSGCHQPKLATGGPSLAEIKTLYPQSKQKQFLQWCKEPGKKRPNYAQMPSMATVPEEELKKIHSYILKVAPKYDDRVRDPKDPQEEGELKNRRPRVDRVFVPDSGPSSAIIALPTKNKLNVIWDADLCRVRYISEGEPDVWPYMKGNGNSLAKVGKVVYTETSPLFKSKDIVYLRMELSSEMFPSFFYTIDGIEIQERFTVSDEKVVRTYLTKDGEKLPEYNQPKTEESKLKMDFKQEKNQIIITHG